jgi:hypothetical protein
MIAQFNSFDIQMTKAQAESISRPGTDAYNDIIFLLEDKKIQRQVKKIDPIVLRNELREYGSWEDLNDHNKNIIRILWIAGGNIIDEIH